MTTPDWKKCDERLVKQMLGEAETYLSSLLQVAMSSDQRSATLAGVFIAAATAIIAGYLAFLATATKFDVRLLVATIFAALEFTVGAFFCITATLPTRWHLAGNEPKAWYGDLRTGKPYLQALGEESENYQKYITRNEAINRNVACKLRWGAMIGMAAPFTGALAFLLAWAIQKCA